MLKFVKEWRLNVLSYLLYTIEKIKIIFEAEVITLKERKNKNVDIY